MILKKFRNVKSAVIVQRGRSSSTREMRVRILSDCSNFLYASVSQSAEDSRRERERCEFESRPEHQFFSTFCSTIFRQVFQVRLRSPTGRGNRFKIGQVGVRVSGKAFKTFALVSQLAEEHRLERCSCGFESLREHQVLLAQR
jgi:hypothetical protein